MKKIGWLLLFPFILSMGYAQNSSNCGETKVVRFDMKLKPGMKDFQKTKDFKIKHTLASTGAIKLRSRPNEKLQVLSAVLIDHDNPYFEKFMKGDGEPGSGEKGQHIRIVFIGKFFPANQKGKRISTGKYTPGTSRNIKPQTVLVQFWNGALPSRFPRSLKDEIKGEAVIKSITDTNICGTVRLKGKNVSGTYDIAIDFNTKLVKMER